MSKKYIELDSEEANRIEDQRLREEEAEQARPKLTKEDWEILASAFPFRGLDAP